MVFITAIRGEQRSVSTHDGRLLYRLVQVALSVLAKLLCPGQVLKKDGEMKDGQAEDMVMGIALEIMLVTM